MLQVCQGFLHVWPMVIVDDRDCSGDFAVCHFLLMFHEVVAHHVTDRQRAVSISFLPDHAVEFFKQGSAYGNTKTRNLIFGHQARLMRGIRDSQLPHNIAICGIVANQGADLQELQGLARDTG